VTAFDLRGLIEALHEHEVRFVVVGGVAVAAHGYVRATADLDLVPEHERDNLERLAHALRSLDATLPEAGGAPFDLGRHLGELMKRRNFSLDTRLGGIDVIQDVPGLSSFSTLDEDAVETDVLGVPVRICSLAELRRMKQATGRAQDLADLEHLPDA
jgi:hypothetical protein